MLLRGSQALRLVEIPGDLDAADRFVGELRESGGGEVEVVLRASVALVLDGGGHALSVVYATIRKERVRVSL